MHHSTAAFVAFILIFIAIYVAIHAYIFYRTRTSLELGRLSNLVIGIFFIAMIFSPFIIRLADRWGYNTISVFFAYTGYTWMGILGILVLLLLFFDITHLLIHIILRIIHRPTDILLHFNKYTYLLSITLTLIFTAVGFFQAQNVSLKEIDIKSKNLPEGTSSLRVLQLSDIHISQTLGYNFIAKLVDQIKEARPDLIVITGDLLDIDVRKNRRIIEAFRSLNPPMGKYAVTGNHEYYAGIDMAIQFYDMIGFRLLKGEYVKVSDGIFVLGVEDDNGKNFDNYSGVTEDRLLEKIQEEGYKILLKHKPFVREGIEESIDLQLSGHTHGGQIFPFSLIVKTLYRYFAGLYKISNRMYLYVSRGTGYWGPPIRFLAPPEMTLFVISKV